MTLGASYQGKLSIGNCMGSGVDPNVGRLELILVDASSRSRIIDIAVDYRGMMAALTGKSDIPCAFIVRGGINHVGMVQEYKTVNVENPDPYTKRSREELKALLAPHETEGWVGQIGDLENHRHSRKDGTYRVSFFRHVTPEGELPPDKVADALRELEAAVQHAYDEETTSIEDLRAEFDAMRAQITKAMEILES